MYVWVRYVAELTTVVCVRCRMSYGAQFGGAVTFRPELFRKINGFPISFFGWGGEDDAMGSRCSRSFVAGSVVASK